MGISIALFAVFALLLAVLALGAIKVFTTRGADGRAQPVGCLAGCALGLVLALLGVAGLVAFLLSLGTQTAARSIPFESVTVLKDSRHAEALPVQHDPWRPLHLVFEVEGHDTPLHELVELVRRVSEGEASVRAVEATDDDGRPVTWVDVALPASENDLRELEREIRKLLPDFRLESGVRVQFRRASRDW
jgi:hypothetical protein